MTAQQPLAERNYRTANVSAAKLRDGGFLLLSNYSSSSERYDFFHTNDIETLSGFVHLGQVQSRLGNENISLITECGTGDLYAVGAQGPGVEAGGENRWELYQVVQSGPSPSLQHLRTDYKNKDEECNARASGTATAGR